MRKMAVILILSTKNEKTCGDFFSTFLSREKIMLVLIKYNEPNLKHKQTVWSALNNFAPHQDKSNKNFNQRNVIFVNSTINKMNNNNFWYMLTLITFILSYGNPEVYWIPIEQVFNKTVFTADSIKLINNFWYIAVFLQSLHK